MKKKLLGLTVALGITALASWSVPAVATDIPPCTGRICIRPLPPQCYCLGYTDFPGKVVTCATWNQVGGCWAE